MKEKKDIIINDLIQSLHVVKNMHDDDIATSCADLIHISDLEDKCDALEVENKALQEQREQDAERIQELEEELAAWRNYPKLLERALNHERRIAQ